MDALRMPGLRRRWPGQPRATSVPTLLLAGMLAVAFASARNAAAQTARDFADLSIEELSQVEVTSVSKRAEPLIQSAASVFVITADDIRRSGATSLTEALRLAPNLEVARVNSQTYTISSRGFNSVNASNKLLVLIDGRSVYTPFFSSVFWDQQDVMLADIDRIEVISGPGGTLYGANAMNGVINVITKRAGDTQGGLVDAKLGNFTQQGAARWGGALGDSGHYRVYAQAVDAGQTTLDGGDGSNDQWNGKQAGFRTDSAAFGGTLTAQGDMYENIIDTPGGRRSGGNVLGRWTKPLADGASFDVQAYYDEQHRRDVGAAGGETSDEVDTFDIQIENNFIVGRSQQIVWGLGQRVWRDQFINTQNPAVLIPERKTLNLTNLFAQDTLLLRDDLKLTIGGKLEYSTFSQWAFMPSVRIGWQPTAKDFVWAAISRAVRPPSRVERDLEAPGIVDQSPDFESEKLIAYETGYRTQLTPQASVSVSLFYNDYTDLRTTKPAPVTIFPVTFGNGIEGHSYGIDAWASWSPFTWWRLNPGLSILRKDFHLAPGEFDIAGQQTVLGHDPGHQVFLHSYMDMPHDTELYVGLRQIGGLSDINVPSYFEADVRLGWHATRRLEVSLAGLNLVHAQHAEATLPPTSEIPRTFYVGARYAF